MLRIAQKLGGVDKFEPVSCGSDGDHAEEALGELVKAGGDGAVDFHAGVLGSENSTEAAESGIEVTTSNAKIGELKRANDFCLARSARQRNGAGLLPSAKR